MKATKSPLGLTRGWLSHPPVWYSTFPMGYSSPAQAAELAHDGEVGSVRRPVRPLHVLEHLTRSAAAQRHSAQRSIIDVGIDVVTVQQNRHLTIG